jgi:hypothetical protein
MKQLFSLLLGVVLSSSCQKGIEAVTIPSEHTTPPKSETGRATGYIDYNIAKGEQYCDKSTFEKVEYEELKFTVKFDSSAIYKTVDTTNQSDINKLFGFSDNNTQHHEFSARFGWCWSPKNGLCLFGYIYNNSVRRSKLLGAISIGEPHNCSIKVTPTSYIFTLDGVAETMPRASITLKGSGYKLFPYFGGDEVAPHDIKILIKEL